MIVASEYDFNKHKNDSLFSISVFWRSRLDSTTRQGAGDGDGAHSFQTQHSSFFYSSEFEVASIALF